MISLFGTDLSMQGALNLVVEEKFRRATPGGTGGVKAITNYAIVSINNSIPIIVLHLLNIYKLLNK